MKCSEKCVVYLFPGVPVVRLGMCQSQRKLTHRRLQIGCLTWIIICTQLSLIIFTLNFYIFKISNMEYIIVWKRVENTSVPTSKLGKMKKKDDYWWNTTKLDGSYNASSSWQAKQFLLHTRLEHNNIWKWKLSLKILKSGEENESAIIYTISFTPMTIDFTLMDNRLSIPIQRVLSKVSTYANR